MVGRQSWEKEEEEVGKESDEEDDAKDKEEGVETVAEAKKLHEE